MLLLSHAISIAFWQECGVLPPHRETVWHEPNSLQAGQAYTAEQMSEHSAETHEGRQLLRFVRVCMCVRGCVCGWVRGCVLWCPAALSVTDTDAPPPPPHPSLELTTTYPNTHTQVFAFKTLMATCSMCSRASSTTALTSPRSRTSSASRAVHHATPVRNARCASRLLLLLLLLLCA